MKSLKPFSTRQVVLAPSTASCNLQSACIAGEIALFRLQEDIGAGIVRAFQGTVIMAAGLLPKERNPLDIQQGLRDSGLEEENLGLAEAISVFQGGLQSLVQVTLQAQYSPQIAHRNLLLWA